MGLFFVFNYIRERKKDRYMRKKERCTITVELVVY